MAASRPSAIIPDHCILLYYCVQLHTIIFYYYAQLHSTLLQSIVPNCLLLYHALHTTLLQSIVDQCILLYYHLQHQPSSSSFSSSTLHTHHPHHHHCRHNDHHHHNCHHHQIRWCMLINGLQSLRWANFNCTAMNYSTNASSHFLNVPT